MKWHVYLLALCLLLMLASSLARASGSSVDMPVTTSFPVSSVAKATDSVLGDISPGPGRIDITTAEHAMYVRLTGPAGNGTRLTSLDDYESGIVFRNNTFLLPAHAEGMDAGTLILTTDNMTADSYGYSGAVTGIQLDSGKVYTSREGQNYTARVLISLTGLPAGAVFRLAFAVNSTPESMASAELEAYGLTAGPGTPLLELSAGNAASGGAIDFVIVTVGAGGNWSEHIGDRNLTFYRYAVDGLTHLRFTAERTADGGIEFQAISPGTGQFLVIAPERSDRALETASDGGGIGLFLLGGLLAMLVIFLAFMVRRVLKR